MAWFSLEHSKTAYGADHALHGLAVVALAFYLGATMQTAEWPGIAGRVLAGFAGWSVMEYGLHRFVLHGLPPFRQWHARHHERPAALICVPTTLSGALIALLIFVPCWAYSDSRHAGALTLGVLTGYFCYAVTHHATHHWRSGTGGWLRRRKRWHAAHHHLEQAACFGVTSALWDHIFGTAGKARGSRAVD